MKTRAENVFCSLNKPGAHRLKEVQITALSWWKSCNCSFLNWFQQGLISQLSPGGALWLCHTVCLSDRINLPYGIGWQLIPPITCLLFFKILCHPSMWSHVANHQVCQVIDYHLFFLSSQSNVSPKIPANLNFYRFSREALPTHRIIHFNFRELYDPLH